MDQSSRAGQVRGGLGSGGLDLLRVMMGGPQSSSMVIVGLVPAVCWLV